MYAHARTSELGQWEAIAAGLIDAYTGGGGGGGSPAPARGPAAGGGTTISPAFQQSFTPQISPVFQQTQDSPGATQAATTTQHAPGGQSARGGSTAAPGAGDFAAPGTSGFPSSAVSPGPVFEDRYAPQFPDAVHDVLTNRPFDWTPVVWIAGIGAAVVLGTLFLRGRERGRR